MVRTFRIYVPDPKDLYDPEFDSFGEGVAEYILVGDNGASRVLPDTTGDRFDLNIR